MNPERWQEVQEFVERALELPAEERSAWLEEQTTDEALRAEVLSLVEAAEDAGGFFTDLAERAGLDTKGVEAAEVRARAAQGLSGRRIGAYQLDALLGRGGMGTVYSAERADGQFSQRVAIKLLTMGATTPEAHRRFVAEREILAGLKHPNITPLFDGGVTEDGTPYFVMELVDGVPLDRFCDENGLGVDERIQLFLSVCDAVSFAHKSLVVHRDLKPANILVADGQVKLLDFGIAKMLGDDHRVHAVTATGQSPMTPAYAAPEQLLGEQVTTSTDVYALGVILHELLTGVSPYDVKSRSGIEMIQAVCEGAVANPSTRIERLRQETETGSGVSSHEAGGEPDIRDLADRRGLTPPSLARRMRGDLDTILLEALKKEPERRYDSVAAFAEDLRLHLRDLPVKARKDTLAYRLSRFIARHSIGVAAAAAILLLAVSLVIMAWVFAETQSSQSQRIANETQRAEGLLSQLTELYETADPLASRGGALASKKLLDAAVRGLAKDEGFDPATRAALLFAAGRVYRRLGAPEDALPLMRESVELREGLPGEGGEDLAASIYELGASLSSSGQAQQGVLELRRALELERGLHGDDHLHVAQVRFALAQSFHDAGGGNAEEEFLEAIRVFAEQGAKPTEEHAKALTSLGDVRAIRGNLDEAYGYYEEALEVYTDLFGPEHPYVGTTLGGLGLILYNKKEKEEGIALMRESVEILREAFGPAGHPDFLGQFHNLGNVLSFEGDPEGIDILEEAMEAHRSRPIRKGTSFGFGLMLLGNARRRVGDLDLAEEAYEEALAVFEATEVQPMFRAETRLQLARMLLEKGPSERAVELFSAVLEGYADVFSEDHPRMVGIREELQAAELR